MTIKTLLKSASKNSEIAWSIGSHWMSHGPSAFGVMQRAYLHQVGVLRGRRQTAASGIQGGSHTLLDTIRYSLMQQPRDCINRNIRWLIQLFIVSCSCNSSMNVIDMVYIKNVGHAEGQDRNNFGRKLGYSHIPFKIKHCRDETLYGIHAWMVKNLSFMLA